MTDWTTRRRKIAVKTMMPTFKSGTAGRQVVAMSVFKVLAAARLAACRALRLSRAGKHSAERAEEANSNIQSQKASGEGSGFHVLTCLGDLGRVSARS